MKNIGTSLFNGIRYFRYIINSSRLSLWPCRTLSCKYRNVNRRAIFFYNLSPWISKCIVYIFVYWILIINDILGGNEIWNNSTYVFNNINNTSWITRLRPWKVLPSMIGVKRMLHAHFIGIKIRSHSIM